MRNDIPAALPLIFLITGLATAPLLVNPVAFSGSLFVAALLAFTIREARRAAAAATVAALFFAGGAALALRDAHRQSSERAAFAALDAESFVTIEAPIERDWAAVDDAFLFRASHFRANGVAFDTPIALYARFEPREIGMEATLHAEGFLRLSERGQYTLSIKSPQLLAYAGTLPMWHPAAWNRLLANRLERHANEHPEEVALAQALVLGRGERLTRDMRAGFRRGGTYHLLVFSGLQIAFAAGVIAALLRWLHAPRASDWLLLAFAALAPLFIGPTASVSRASVAIALYALSRILRRPTSVENLWCVAALLWLVIEPRDLTDVSFHLTYAGAGALLFIGRHIARGRWFAHAAAAELTIAPLTLFHFHQYALGGSLLTLAMSPLIFAMLIVSMLCCAWPSLLPAIGFLHRLCGLLNALGISGYFAAPPLSALLAGASGVMLALLLFRGGRRALALSLALLVPSAAAVLRSESQRVVPHPRVTFFDVGQGDGIAVRSGKQTMIIDAGRDGSMLPLLADRGVRKIDLVLLTHAHPDHCGGLPSIIGQFEVGSVWVSPRRLRGECAAEILAACSASRVPLHLIRDGESIHLGEFAMSVYLADQTFRHSPENNASVVLRAEAAGRRFLFTGDIEREAELTIADRELSADVLKVAHHGSRSSTSAALLESVRPRLAVISCGRRNLFGHPHTSVLDALRERHIRTWRTDRDGTIDIDIEKGHLYASGGSG